MKRALIKNNLTLMIVAFLVFFLIVVMSLYLYGQSYQKKLVSFVLSEVELEYESYEGSIETFISIYSNENGRRITLLDSNRIVMIDSHDDEIGQDKSMRPEIENLGQIATRNSETIGIDLVYMATELSDGNILRVAIPIESHVNMYSAVLWILIGVSAIIIGLYYVGLKKLNKSLLTPWDKVKVGLNHLSQGEYQVMSLTSPYPEINELLNEMNRINLETDRHLKSIETYQIQLKEILNELKQAVMLFDYEEHLVYYNQDAELFFHLTEEAYDKPAYVIIRYHELQKAIQEVNRDSQNRIFDMKYEGKLLEVKVFHVDAEGRNKTKATVLVLIKDVSHERAIEQIKKDFFSHASHELKSPLTAIRGYAELIEHQVIQPEDYKKTAHEIVLHTENMAALVEDMLMLSRLENIKEKSYSSVQLDHLLKETIGLLKPHAEQKQMNFHVNIQPVHAVCDAINLQKLFKNLIENAIKYSDANKHIEIKLYREDDMVIFLVKDQGIGISEEHQQRVFERFYRVDKGRLDGGTGLGLAIVKHITLKYEGTIDLKSSLSRGTTMIVKLHL